MNFSFYISGKFLKNSGKSNFFSFISTICIIGIALGVAAVIIALTILKGFEKTVSEKIVNFNSHLVITGFSGRNLEDYRKVKPNIEAIIAPFSEIISPFTAKLVIIKSRFHSEGITLKGIIPELSITEFSNFTLEGNADLKHNFKEFPTIVIGKKLADKLRIKLNDKVTIFSLKNNQIPSENNPPGIKQFHVSGIYESGMSEYDDLFAFSNLTVAQGLFGIDNEISGYNIKLNDISRIDSLSNILGDYLGYPYYVRTIFKVHQNIFTWLELQKEPIPIILGLIVIVAVFNIIGTLLMLVLERTNAIGILRSLGAGRKFIIKIFLLQGLFISSIGIILGVTIALTFSIIQINFGILELPSNVYFINKVPISIEVYDYMMVTFITILVSIIVSFIPSYIASKISAISSLRFK